MFRSMLRRAAALLVAVQLAACAEEEPDEPLPPALIGPELYAFYPYWCGECSVLTLSYTYNDSGPGYALELRAHSRLDGSYVGRQLAVLWPDASDELDALRDIDDVGAPPGGVPLDVDGVELWLPDLSLRYAKGYPPSGLVELDKFLYEQLDDLAHCRHTTRLDVPWDCEKLSLDPYDP
jgi:hypothetical protein